jgi:hypothetical protein
MCFNGSHDKVRDSDECGNGCLAPPPAIGRLRR